MGKPIDPARLGEDFAFQLLPEDWEHFQPMMANALHRLPVLETAQVRMLLNGPESFTPDGAFLLGEAAETRGFFLGCGMNSVGIASGGGAGMALAHGVAHGHPPSDLTEVDPRRFPDVLNSVAALTTRVPEVLSITRLLFRGASGPRHAICEQRRSMANGGPPGRTLARSTTGSVPSTSMLRATLP
jgi:4-methylaminobutanoate oxidase (formaldehyde-forming)